MTPIKKILSYLFCALKAYGLLSPFPNRGVTYMVKRELMSRTNLRVRVNFGAVPTKSPGSMHYTTLKFRINYTREKLQINNGMIYML